MVTCAQSICTGVPFPICDTVWTSSFVTISYSFVFFCFLNLGTSLKILPKFLFLRDNTLVKRLSMSHFKKLACESWILCLPRLPVNHYTSQMIKSYDYLGYRERSLNYFILSKTYFSQKQLQHSKILLTTTAVTLL